MLKPFINLEGFLFYVSLYGNQITNKYKDMGTITVLKIKDYVLVGYNHSIVFSENLTDDQEDNYKKVNKARAVAFNYCAEGISVKAQELDKPSFTSENNFLDALNFLEQYK